MAKKSEEKLKFAAEVSKVLQLMIHSLYTNKDIFLRELVSNASDACDKLRHAAITQPELTTGDTELKIDIAIDKKARTLTITDNGIGMSREELVENLGTIAKSGTQEFLKQLGDKDDMPLIGQFGVGFYSSFMVADKVTVVSTRAGSKDSWQWQSEGEGEFSVAPAEASPRGTRITLHLKKDAEDYLDKFRLRHIVTTYSDHISFPISIADEGEAEVVNRASALWTRPKADVTPEQYREFYHHVAHAPDEPWMILHNRAEGKLEYVNLLFIPSAKPFDLFHPDRKRRVKLYVKRVFITEENVDLVPAYMRFLRGVIDSEDLPLNISRETLQHNPLLTKIRDSVVKRVLSELKKRSENPVGRDSGSTGSQAAGDPAQSLRDSQDNGYNIFWKNFGAVLKEGLCEAGTPREPILEVCRFYSTHGEAFTSLDDYISRMKPGQNEIFYLTGEDVNALRANSHLEGFEKRGIEVLLFSDHVDDFWVNVTQEYKGKKFKSVTRADIDLNTIAPLSEEKTEEKKSADIDARALCERIKLILGDKVKDVRATSKLDKSAVCLAVEEGAMDLRLERFLVEQKQLQATTAKILEINPAHPIIKSLEGKLSDPAAAAELEDVIWLLFDQARLLEGEAVTDPAAFTRRLQGFVEKSLAA